MIALALLSVCNLGYAIYSRRTLGAAIKATQDSLVALVAGRVREIGPIEAQQQALQKQARGRQAERLVRPTPLNL